METLSEKVEYFILKNNSGDNPKTIGEIISYFQSQGYSNKEITVAINLFNKKYIKSNSAEYDT